MLKTTVVIVPIKGNTNAWEQRKLGEIAEIIGGGTPSTSIPAYWDGDIDWYAPAEMEGQRYAVKSVRTITEAGLKNSSARMLPAGKTILFTSRAGIGKIALLQRTAATNQGFQSIVLRDGFSAYFIYSMGSILKNKAGWRTILLLKSWIGSTVSKQPRLKQKRSTLAGLLKPPNKIVYFFPCSAFGKCSGRIRRLSGYK